MTAVAHYIDAEIFGGCEEVVLTLLAGLDRQRWKPVLFHHGGKGISRLIQETDRLDIPSRVVPRLSRKHLLQSVRQFTATLRDVRPAIFHAHLNWPLACRAAVTAARLSGVPSVVATSHLYSSLDGVRFAWLKQRVQAASIDRYLAVSAEVKNRLCGDLRVAQSKVQVVRNGIRMTSERAAPNAALRVELTGSSDRPIVFTPARLHTQKGHRYLLEAATLVPDACFVLAGDGPERSALEQQARELGIHERVRFLGQRQDVPQLLSLCDLFVLPSLYEGLPLSVLEAMAAGKPIVATRIGGTDEAIADGATGLLVAPGKPDELASAIRTLLADRPLAARLASAAFAHARQEFSADLMVRNVSAVYDELVEAY